jgi:DNA-binding NarL/FixJ family response regulator
MMTKPRRFAASASDNSVHLTRKYPNLLGDETSTCVETLFSQRHSRKTVSTLTLHSIPLTASPNGTLPSLEARPAEVLIADELTLVREGLAALCNRISGFQVISQVGTAAAALAEIQRLQPTIALLDLGLSDLAATEVIRQVRARGNRTRCAVFSVRKDRKTVLEVLRTGACGYLLKSSSFEQMADALSQFIQGGIYVSPQIEMMSLFGDAGSRHADDPLESLSSREFQVFSLLVEGVRAKEIAARLSLSPKTVDTYRSSLMRKLDIHDVAGLVKFAIKRDLADLRP